MTDFYTELKLSPDSSLQEIQSELLRLEQLWRRREINSPETATAKLTLINEAKKVFVSESSRNRYNQELENSRRKPVASNPKADRYNQWKKWYDTAISYYKSSQFDLAKTAIEKALSHMDLDSDDAAFYNDAAKIYLECQAYSTAMDYINKAIVYDPDTPDYLITKGFIYYAFYEANNTGYENNQRSISQALSMFRSAAKKVISSGSKSPELGQTLAFIVNSFLNKHVFSYWSRDTIDPNNPYLPIIAEIATYAIEIGDNSGTAENVLSQINQGTEAFRRQKEEKEAESKRREEESRRQQKEREREYRRKQEAERLAEEKKSKQEEEKRRKQKIATKRAWIIGFVFSLLGIIAGNTIKGYYVIFSIFETIAGCAFIYGIVGLFRRK